MFKFLAVASVVVLTAVPAVASVVINIEEIGTDVVASFSGTVDVTGLESDGTGTLTPGIFPLNQEITLQGGAADFFNLETGFGDFTTLADAVFPTSTSGDVFSISVSFSGAPNALGVAQGFTGGGLSGSATFANSDFADLGLTAGTSFVASSLNDTFTLNIVGDTISAVPLPASLPLLFAGLGALGLARRKNSEPSQH